MHDNNPHIWGAKAWFSRTPTSNSIQSSMKQKMEETRKIHSTYRMINECMRVSATETAIRFPIF